MNINISLSKAEVDRLVDLAKADGREPREQAAVLVRRALERVPAAPVSKSSSPQAMAEHLIELLEQRGLLGQILEDE